MSPPKEINAAPAWAIAATSAWRTGGFAAFVSFGSWKRASPQATKRKGVLSSSCSSTGWTAGTVIGECEIEPAVQQKNRTTLGSLQARFICGPRPALQTDPIPLSTERADGFSDQAPWSSRAVGSLQ